MFWHFHPAIFEFNSTEYGAAEFVTEDRNSGLATRLGPKEYWEESNRDETTQSGRNTDQTALFVTLISISNCILIYRR